MRLAAARNTEQVAEEAAIAAFDSLRTALIRPVEPAEARVAHVPADKPGDTAVAMRLASEAIAAAARSVESELRRMREQVDEAEARARAAELRAQEAERLLAEIRDRILGTYPEQRERAA
ncbi:MAG TPA: hypothetical protein VH743_18375 [Beijerinckiaceae bacterium]|jgi:hypothetical protein